MKQFIYSIGILFFTSFGSAAQIVEFEENFDTGIPSSFVMYNRDGYTPHANVSEYTEAWISKQDPSDVSNTVVSSTSYFDSPGMADRWLITPSISLGEFGNYLSWTAKSHDASFSEGYLVLLSTTDTAVESFTDTLKAVPFEDVYWTNHLVNLSEKGFDDQIVHIAFVLRTIDGFKFYMDSLKVVVEDPVSIEKQEPIVAFKLYPNPTTDKIMVQADVSIQNIIIRDINGAMILQTEEKAINIQHLSNGVYFVELVHEKGVSSRRFIKN
jgi:hypothetical protein